MASVRRRGKTFMGLYRDSEGQQRSAGTYSTERQALKAARLGEAGYPHVKDQALFNEKVRGKQTVASYSAEWLPSHPLSANARFVYNQVLLSHVLPVLGNKALSEVSVADVRTMFRKLEDKGTSSALGKKIRTVLSALMQTAAEDGLIPVNPVRGTRLQTVPPKRRRALTADEWRRLRDCLKGEDRLLAEVQMSCGARIEEIKGMMAEDITDGVWHVQRVRKEQRDGFVTVDRTKTGKDRYVRLDPVIVEKIGERGPGRVFSDSARDAHWKRWRTACRAAGLDWYPAPRDLRRSFATLARAGGADLEAVRVALGHTKLSTTDVYLDERAETGTEAMLAVQRMIGAA